MKNVFFMLIYMSVTIFLSGHGIKSDSTVSYSSILSNKRTDCPVSLKEIFLFWIPALSSFSSTFPWHKIHVIQCGEEKASL